MTPWDLFVWIVAVIAAFGVGLGLLIAAIMIIIYFLDQVF